MTDPVPRISRAIGDLMRVAGSERVHASRQAATGIALSRTELRFLLAVGEDGPLPVTALGALLHLSQPTASRSLRSLEERGYVRRSVDQADGRVARYELTASGAEVRGRYLDHMDAQLDESLAGMPAADRRRLAELLEQLVAGTHRRRDA